MLAQQLVEPDCLYLDGLRAAALLVDLRLDPGEMSRIMCVDHPAQHLGVPPHAEKLPLAGMLRDTCLHADGSAVSRELFKDFRNRLDAEATPPELALEKESVVERDAVVRADLHEDSA